MYAWDKGVVVEWQGYCKCGNYVIIIKRKVLFRKYIPIEEVSLHLKLLPCLTGDNGQVLSTQFFFHSFAIILTLHNQSLLSFDF